jgi:hypothetical protein
MGYREAAAQPIPITRLAPQIARPSSVSPSLPVQASRPDAIWSGQRRNPLHEIKDALGLQIFFAQNGFDDFRGVGFGDVDSRLAQLAVEVLF